jgi:hypothetical protein
MSLPDPVSMNYLESSLPPGLPLPKYRELRVQHAPMVKAQGRMLLMVAAVYGGWSGWRNGPEWPGGRA